MSWLGALATVGKAAAGFGSAASSTGGVLQSIHHSPVQKASWGDYLKQEVFDRRAEARALSNAKDLFAYQEMSGPGLSMAGYRRAGLNPILAGDYNGSMPSAPTPSASPAPHDFVNNASNLINAGSAFASLAESLSRVEVNEANAKAIQSRTDIENQLLAGRLALQQADLATKSHLPGYYQAQAERLRSDIAINQIRRTLMDSQISLNNAKQTSMWNHDMLELEKFLYDKEYKDKYLKQLHESYFDNKYVGRLYLSDIGQAFKSFSEVMGGLFQRGIIPRMYGNPELP